MVFIYDMVIKRHFKQEDIYILETFFDFRCEFINI